MRIRVSTSRFARVVKGEDLSSSAHKCAWVQTPQPASFFFVSVHYMSNEKESAKIICLQIGLLWSSGWNLCIKTRSTASIYSYNMMISIQRKWNQNIICLAINQYSIAFEKSESILIFEHYTPSSILSIHTNKNFKKRSQMRKKKERSKSSSYSRENSFFPFKS